ncbi:MAG: hypothetical protein ACFBSG_03530 [Leptolyngbyaceae cyanobacterium]
MKAIESSQSLCKQQLDLTLDFLKPTVEPHCFEVLALHGAMHFELGTATTAEKVVEQLLKDEARR